MQKGSVCRQAGFAPVLVLIGIMVIMAIAGGAYYFGKSQTPKPQSQNLMASSQPSVTPTTSNFNLIFKYGVGARNELDTFEGTYTKDMVSDPPVKIKMSLSREETDRIYQKMLEIDFFDYPDKFSVTLSTGEPIGTVTPCSKYYFKVANNSKIKELSWDDCITNKNERADKLRELIKYIENIIKSRTEYKKLPIPRGGYL